MKKYICLFIILFGLVGCSKNIEFEKETVITRLDYIGDEPTIYYDKNNTPISFYKNKKKLDYIKTNIQVGKDIGLYNVYPSNDNNISYNYFGQAFNDSFKEYNKDNNLRIGYNLKYSTTDRGDVSHTILSVNDTFDYEGYILIFLYDDYDIYSNNKVYSHVEVKNDTSNTLYSSIKLYPQSSFPKVNSKITLTVFTYDGMDDFDENKEYIGNSKSTIVICDDKKTC